MSHCTCAFSNLPIEEGRDVKIVLLLESPYNLEKSHKSAFSTNSLWTPRSIALDATMDEFGRCRNIESDTIKQLILDLFQEDLIEVGEGNNITHDCAVYKNMSFDQIMNGIISGRVYVHSTNYFDDSLDYEFPDFFPNLYSVKKIVNGLKINNLVVDELAYGVVRVRHSSFYAFDFNTILPHFSQFACCIRAGSTGFKQELILFVPPNEKYLFSQNELESKSKDKTIISYAYIRKDVWDKMLTFKCNEHFRNIYYSDFDKLLSTIKDECKRDVDDLNGGYISLPLRNTTYPFRLDYTLQFNAIKYMTNKNKINEVIRGLAELIFISMVLGNNRMYWAPNGIMFGSNNDYKDKIQFYSAMAEIAKGCVK
jgi:hypothetical protein